MMQFSKMVSPLCLALSLLMLILAFALVFTEAPGESVQLHSARAEGDELVESALSNQLAFRLWFRRLLLAALFCFSIFMAILAFVTQGGKA